MAGQDEALRALDGLVAGLLGFVAHVVPELRRILSAPPVHTPDPAPVPAPAVVTPATRESTAGASEMERVLPSPPGKRGAPAVYWSPERDAVLKTAWLANEPTQVIAGQINAMPGRPVTTKLVRQRARRDLKLGGVAERLPSTVGATAMTPSPSPPEPPSPTSASAVTPPPEEPVAAEPAPVHVRIAGESIVPSPEVEVEGPTPPTPKTETAVPRAVYTRDGHPSVAAMIAAAAMPDPGQAEPVTWRDALQWAHFNNISVEGTGREVLARINAARHPMPPWRIVPQTAAHDPLPPPTYGAETPRRRGRPRRVLEAAP